MAVLSARPRNVVRVSTPVAAPTGTCTVRLVTDCAVRSASALLPPKRTPRTAFRLVPVRVTSVPAGPLWGEKPARVGGRAVFKRINSSA